MKDDSEIKRMFGEISGTGEKDSGEFMAELDRRLDMVEPLKKYHDSQIRKYRGTSAAAFFAGVLACAAGIRFVLLNPGFFRTLRDSLLSVVPDIPVAAAYAVAGFLITAVAAIIAFPAKKGF